MFRGSAASLCLTLSFGAASAQAPEVMDLGLGSHVFWISNYDGSTDRYSEKLIAQGEDFAIYKNQSDWSGDEPGDYFALFAGIYFQTCDLEMPTRDERDALIALRPFQPGTTIDIESGDGAKVVVGSAKEFFLMGRNWPAHLLTLTYQSEDGESEEAITVLNDMPLTVAINWDHESRDTAMLVTRSKPDVSAGLNQDLIGTCASLLRDPEE